MARAIDRGYPMGVESYRVQSLPEKTELHVGDEVKFSLADVGFNPARMQGYQDSHKESGGNAIWFRLDPSTPGLIFDDSGREKKTADEFHRYPIEGITRGRFHIRGDGTLPGSERKYVDLEYQGPYEPAPEFEDGESGTLGSMAISSKARERVFYAMQEAQLAVKEAAGRSYLPPDKASDLTLSMDGSSHAGTVADYYMNLMPEWDQEEEDERQNS
jgi:hypothetical protein